MLYNINYLEYQAQKIKTQKNVVVTLKKHLVGLELFYVGHF